MTKNEEYVHGNVPADSTEEYYRGNTRPSFD